MKTGAPAARAGWGFFAPFGVLFAVFFLVPIAYAIYGSLHKVVRSGLYGVGGGREVFAGLDNYRRAFVSDHFLASLLRVVEFAAVQVPVMIVLATALALLLDSASARWPGFFRAMYFMPHGVPGVIASILWGFLYVPGISPIVSALDSVGLHVDFLGARTVLFAIVNIVTWQTAGYTMLVIIAQLASVPGELYEAARMDGASSLSVIRHIKLPLVRPAIVLTTVFTIIWSLQLFSEPLILRSNSAHISSTYTPNLSAYSAAFSRDDYHLAAAEAVLLALVTCVLSFGFLRLVAKGTRG